MSTKWAAKKRKKKINVYFPKDIISLKYLFPHPVPKGHKETLQLIFIPQVLAWYIQYQHIYSNDTFSKKKSHFPTLCPKGTQKPINLNSSPKCWHVISNTKLFIQLTYISQIVGTIYKYSYITLTCIYFQKNSSIIQYIYILSSSFSYQVHFKNITYVESMWFEAVFVFFCICVSVYLQF